MLLSVVQIFMKQTLSGRSQYFWLSQSIWTLRNTMNCHIFKLKIVFFTKSGYQFSFLELLSYNFLPFKTKTLQVASWQNHFNLGQIVIMYLPLQAHTTIFDLYLHITIFICLGDLTLTLLTKVYSHLFISFSNTYMFDLIFKLFILVFWLIG